jgi:hypothetical protein
MVTLVKAMPWGEDPGARLMTLSKEKIKSPEDQQVISGLIGYLMADRERARTKGVSPTALAISSGLIDTLALPTLTNILDGVGRLEPLQKKLLAETIREAERNGDKTLLERVVTSGGGKASTIIQTDWWTNKASLDMLLKAAGEK